jgi:hypothetical protein
MLNELYTAQVSLEKFGVSADKSHPWVKRLGRAELLIASVDSSGLVTKIEQMNKLQAVALFKIQASNHTNFPQVNWNSPIWSLNQDSNAVREWRASAVIDVRLRVDLLRNICADAGVTRGQERILARMQEFCQELEPRFGRDSETEFAAFPVLINRILIRATSASEWFRSLSDAALSAAASGSAELLAAVETLLAGKFDKKTNRFQDAKVAILFDLADCTRFRCRIASPRMGGYFGRRLNATEEPGRDAGRCSLTGIDMPLETDKMPSPRLPVLGDTVLMSMNPDTPCQTRYGRTGTDIFPLGKATVSNLDSALKHLTAIDREGKNWKRIPGKTKKHFNLLLVYLESSPLIEVAIAEMFSGSDESDQLYATVCMEVCDALRGRVAKDSELLRIFVLNKIDPGRVQIELSESFTAEQVIRGGSEWQEGARNRPALQLKGDDHIPSPAEVMRCLQMMWERSGAAYSDAPGCSLAVVFDVLVADRQGAAAAAATLLRITLQRTMDLLVAVGHAIHRGDKEAWKGISKEAGNNPVIATSLLGIILFKLGHRKEKYMGEPAFLIGRFLSLADTLHREYCKGARDGGMPPQLLGNALIPTAISDPNKGLARMLQRIRVYQAWAGGKKGTRLARWSCGEMGKIANELAGRLIDRRFNEVEQAQLLLGYLARSGNGQETMSGDGEDQ